MSAYETAIAGAPIVAAVATVILAVAAAIGADRAYALSNAARALEPWPGPEPGIIDFGAYLAGRRERERVGELASVAQRAATFSAIGAAIEGAAGARGDVFGLLLVIVGLAFGIATAGQVVRAITRQPLERARIAYEVWSAPRKYGPRDEAERFALFERDDPKAAALLRSAGEAPVSSRSAANERPALLEPRTP